MELAIVAMIVAVVFIYKAVYIVRQSEVIIVERLGSYCKTMNNGINILIPFVDATRSTMWQRNGITGMYSRIDMREIVLDVDEQSVITADNVNIMIDAIMYVQLIDPKKAVYDVANLPSAVSNLAQTSLRSLIGEMELDQTLSSREQINTQLKLVLDEATDKWGLKVNRVELKNITPPADVQAAMERQMQAERTRRATVLEAEGDKQARIARSEGERQEKINFAQGEKEATYLKAEGEAKAIERIAEAQAEALEKIIKAIGNHPELAVRYLTAINYLERFGKFTQQSGDKVFIPYDASGTLGSFGSINELFQNKVLGK